MSTLNPESPRCVWCDQRCRNQSELIEHEATHSRSSEDLAAELKRMADLGLAHEAA